MRVKVKLMGMLKDRSPEGDQLDLADDATIADVLAELNIDHQAIQAFSINGSIEREPSTKLSDGDELIVLPPVGGG